MQLFVLLDQPTLHYSQLRITAKTRAVHPIIFCSYCLPMSNRLVT